MQLELHQLDLRYERLRTRNPRRERLLLGSLSEQGQQLPVVVVRSEEAGRYVVVDGYKRLRALRRLGHDTVEAVVWEIGEAEALLLERLMRRAEAEGALEQGWLLVELRDRFGLPPHELARRFDKTASWVSRRLALVEELPAKVQDHVRAGAIIAHAAMKYLVPLARANAEACERLSNAIAPLRLGSRQVGALYEAWMGGSEQTREHLVAEPALLLRALDEARRKDPGPRPPSERLLIDFTVMERAARRVLRQVRAGVWGRLSPPERGQVAAAAAQLRAELEALFTRLDKEAKDAGPRDPHGDPDTA